MNFSAGIIPYRINNDGEFEFLVGHPGGQTWEHRNYWAYLKGGVEEGEDYKETAIREFQEESGYMLSDGEKDCLIPLGMTQQNTKKTVIAYGLHCPNINAGECFSNMADNGICREIDSYRWMTYDTLKSVTHPKHLIFYETLIDILNGNN